VAQGSFFHKNATFRTAGEQKEANQPGGPFIRVFCYFWLKHNKNIANLCRFALFHLSLKERKNDLSRPLLLFIQLAEVSRQCSFYQKKY
jgi:hypothetical protein